MSLVLKLRHLSAESVKKLPFFAGAVWWPPGVCLRVLVGGGTLEQCFCAREWCRNTPRRTLWPCRRLCDAGDERRVMCARQGVPRTPIPMHMSTFMVLSRVGRQALCRLWCNTPLCRQPLVDHRVRAFAPLHHFFAEKHCPNVSPSTSIHKHPLGGHYAASAKK